MEHDFRDRLTKKGVPTEVIDFMGGKKIWTMARFAIYIDEQR